MEDTKDIQEKKNTPLLVLKIVGNVIFYAIILLILLFSIANIRGKNARDSYPNVFGKGFLTVESNSMDGNFSNSFKKGDLIIVSTPSKKYTPKVGDIITYVDKDLKNDTNFKKSLNTHRIVYITEDNYIYTMGDKAIAELFKDVTNPTEMFKDFTDEQFLEWKDDTHLWTDSDNVRHSSANVYEIANTSLIKGVYSSTWSGAGTFFYNMTTPLYFGIFVCIPVLIFLAFEIFRVYKNIKAIRNDGKENVLVDKEALKAQLREELLKQIKDEEAEKEKMRAEIMAELKAKETNNDVENNPQENVELNNNALNDSQDSADENNKSQE